MGDRIATRLAGAAAAAALALGGAAVALVFTAAPAAAHSVSGQGATNWRSTLVSVTPTVPGLKIRIVELGSRMEVTNTGPEVLVLSPIQREPFLRIGPDGVFENRNSPYTYLSKTRQSDVPVPESADPSKPPDWARISTGRTARWHEHAVHFMGSRPPKVITDSPQKFHHFSNGTVTLTRGPTEITVAASLDWVPAEHTTPWLLVAAGAAAATLLLGLLDRTWTTGLAAVTAAVVTADIVHAFGIGFTAAGGIGAQLLRVFAGSFYSAVGWILGAVAVRLLLRRSVDGLYAAVFAGLSAGIFSGIVDFNTLTRSQAPFAWGLGLDRTLVATALGGGIGLAAASILRIRKQARLEHAGQHEQDQPTDDPEQLRPRLQPPPGLA